MLRNYNWLITILGLALLSIIILQAVYSVQNFRLQSNSFAEEVNVIFEAAIKQERDNRKEQLLDWFRSSLADTSQILISTTFDSIEQRPIIHIQDKGNDSPYTSISFGDDHRKITALGSLNDQISIDRIIKAPDSYLEQGIIYHWTEKTGDLFHEKADSLTINLEELNQLFEGLLIENNINTSHQIDSIQSDSLLTSISSSVIRTNRFKTSLFFEKGLVYAQLNNPFFAILKRTWLSVSGSFLVILLTVSCFYIMLRIIFRQKQLAQIKDDFIDNMTHELQTPIATLMAANESLEKYNLLQNQEKSKQYLAISKEQIQRLSQMVDRILLNSIYDRKAVKYQVQHLDVKSIIENTIANFKLQSPNTVIVFQKDAPLPNIWTDPVHFKQIIENLIENAIKHNPEHPNLEIKIEVKTNDKNLILSVNDNGKGIADKLQPQVFEKYYRLEEANANGYGIGLYYVRKTLGELGGQIQLRSIPNQGCKFIFEIPIDKV